MTENKQKLPVKSEEKINKLSSALRKNLQRRKVAKKNADKVTD